MDELLGLFGTPGGTAALATPGGLAMLILMVALPRALNGPGGSTREGRRWIFRIYGGLAVFLIVVSCALVLARAYSDHAVQKRSVPIIQRPIGDARIPPPVQHSQRGN